MLYLQNRVYHVLAFHYCYAIFLYSPFVKGRQYESLEELTRELHDYVHWFNHICIHSTLGYASPVEYKNSHLKNVV
ncbi:IS3 family transposase [Cytobacillus sp. Hm23]